MEGGVNEPTDKLGTPHPCMDLCYDDRNITRGIYTLKKQVGNNVKSLCDVGNCCDMAHYMLDKHSPLNGPIKKRHIVTFEETPYVH